MITTTEAFKQAIKANVVRARAKIVFNYATPLTVSQDKIVNMSITQRGEVALGCVQDDKLTISLKADALSNEQYGQDVTVKAYMGCDVNGTDEYCNVGTFKITKWGKGDYTIDLELGSNIPETAITDILSLKDVTLSSYITSAISKLIGVHFTLGSITDGALYDAYLFYKTIKEQLKAFAFACGGIFRYSDTLELVPYKFGTPVAVYKEGPGEMIMDKSGDSSDLVTSKTNYELARSMFTKEEDASLFSATNVRVTEDDVPYAFGFSSPSLVGYISFKKYAYFSTLKYGLFGGYIGLYSPYEGVTSYVDFNIIGTKINSIVLKATINDSTTFLSNPYIQTSAQVTNLSLDIYNGQRYSFKSRIDPSLQVGDTITVFGVGDMLITSLNYKFDGGLTGTIEGVLKT